jgi:sugar phosphate permease
MTTPATKRGTFYGWYIVGALFFATFLAIGSRQSFGVFVETWEEEWEVSVGTISIAASLGWLLNGFAQPFFGRMNDRSGGRSVILISLLVLAVGLLAMPLTQNVIMLTFVYGVIVAVGTGGISPAITAAIAARWFRRQRGTATSVLVSGGSIGGLVLVPFMTYLFLATSWQTAWLVAGLIALCLGLPLVYTIVRSDPAELGLEPDGDAQEEPGSEAARRSAREGPLTVARWQQSFQSAPMWQLSLAYWVCGVTTASVAVHFVRWASDEGISPGTAALAFGLLSGINACSVILVGALSDRMERKMILAAVYAIRGLAFVAIITLPGPVAIWAFAVIGGSSWLATVPLTSSLTADIYGLKNLGILGGLINMTHQIGGALAVILFGVAFDIWGTYDVSFTASAILLGAAALLVMGLRERRYSLRYLDEAEPAAAGGGA